MLRSLLCLFGFHELGRPMAVRFGGLWFGESYYVCDRRCRHCGTVKETPYQP